MTTTCPPDCGACCDPVVLVGFQPEDMDGPSGPFAREHWTVTAEGHDERGWVYEAECDCFDKHTRQCTAYADRPPICSGFPWYGQDPDRERYLNPACAFHADVRTVLPIVAVTHGR